MECSKEQTVVLLMQYFKSQDITVIGAEYDWGFPRSMFGALERNSMLESIPTEKLKTDVATEHTYEKDGNLFHFFIRCSGIKVVTVYDFLKRHRAALTAIASEQKDAINLSPAQIDDILDGNITFCEPPSQQDRIIIKASFHTPRTMFISASIIKRTAKNQRELDELGAIIVLDRNDYNNLPDLPFMIKDERKGAS